MAGDIRIRIEGLDKLLKALAKFPQEARHYLRGAGEEASRDAILKTTGLQKYPPSTAANQPPAPYYKRGVGMVYTSRIRATSERLGTQWTVKSDALKTTISNRASYAKWVHGEQQARAMARIGWHQLFETAKEKQSEIQAVYNKWVAALLRKLEL